MRGTNRGWIWPVLAVLAILLISTRTTNGTPTTQLENEDVPFVHLHGPNGLLAKLSDLNATEWNKEAETWYDTIAHRQGRVVGGLQATAGQFKFYVSIQFNGFPGCGGSFISPSYILTAAHCFDPPGDVDITTVSISYNSITYRQGLEIPVSNFFVHPQWNRNTMNYDFAVLQLSSPGNAAFMQSVTLDDGSVNRVGQMATAIGFGLTSEGGNPPDFLRYVDFPVLASADCANSSAMVGLSMLTSMLCAGSSGKDTCQGDSGGPLVIRNSLIQVGITSYGLGCARPTYPGAVYSRVSAAKAWIDTIKSQTTPTPAPPTPTLTPGIADTCAAPKTITCGQTIFASMASATSNDPDSLVDGYVDQWYLFSGINGDVTVSTCSSLTNFDTVVEVFTGQCSSLNLYSYNDDNVCDGGSSLTSTLLFAASQGTQYRIRLRPYNVADATNRYKLIIQCDPAATSTSPTPTRSRTPSPTRSRTPSPTRSRTPSPTRSRTPSPTRSRTPSPTRSRTPSPTRTRTPTSTPTRTRSPSPLPYANDVCAAPNALSCGSTITASLRGASSADPDSLNDGYADMWYSITGQGRAITLSTCHNNTSFDTYLEVFSGACSSLSRVAQNDDTAVACNTDIGKITSRLTWTAQTNALYRVRVRGYNGAIGNYGLITTCA